MASFNLRIESSKSEASVVIQSEGFGGNGLTCDAPADVLLKIFEAINGLQTSLSGDDETQEKNPQEEIEEEKVEQTCRECGRTNDAACEGPCWWVEDDLCSACEKELQRQAAEEAKSEKPKNQPKYKNKKPTKPTKAAKADDSAEWEGYLNIKQVSEKIGKTEPNIHLMASKGLFPKADKKVGIKNAWEIEAVETWIWQQANPESKLQTGAEEEEELESEVPNLEIEPEDAATDTRADKLMSDF